MLNTIIEKNGVNLSEYIKNNHNIELKELLKIALQLTKAIKDIHSKNIIHKNINPSNIIYNYNKNIIKLSGFDNSSELSFANTEVLNPNIFSNNLYYISPEQTGRMNRRVDYRTDFYSLGVILYELAGSKSPFASSDPADIVYFHIAKTPISVNKINSKIPTVVSKIISKLMEKMPEDRYNSAVGIEFDLQECINQLNEKGIIEEFELGKNDKSDKFEIPKKIYGRDNEIKRLLNLFEKSEKGNAEIVLVGGYSGSGKSALVNELHKPIIRENGIFLSGKCDQYNKNNPYSSIFNALDQFCTYILSDSEAELEEWKVKILNSLGENIALLIDSIPKLQLIIGSEIKTTKKFNEEISNKFGAALENLLVGIATNNRQFVFFIDDLQWIDTDSLKLFEKILSDNRVTGLMFICTYRENEIDKSHPLIRTIRKMEKNKAKIEYLHLENLDINSVIEMLSDIFSYRYEEVYDLAKLVYEKTMGNPFYITEFLKYCNEEEMIYYNFSEKRWMWNKDDIKNSKTLDNVVEFLIEKMKILPENTKELISIAACVGTRFDIKILSKISGKSIKNIIEDLKPAIDSEMIYVLGKGVIDYEKVEFMFCHDKFQQAGYLALSEKDKKIIHLNIAGYYESIEEKATASSLFLVADHYSKVIDYISGEDDLKKVINIFLMATKAARRASAFYTSKKYIELIIEIIPKDLKRDDSFMKSIYEEYQHVLFCLADFEKMDKIYSKIEGITKEPIELVDAYCIQLISLSNRSRFEEAFYLGISLLEKFGIIYQENKLIDVIETEIKKYYLYEKNGYVDKIIQEEIISDKKYNAITKVVNRIIAASLFFNPLASFWLAFINANMIVENGVTNCALGNLSGISIALIPLKNDFYTGYKLSKETMLILEKKGIKEELYRSYHIHSLVNCHWFEPLETAIHYAHKSYKGNLECGEFEFSCFSFFTLQAAVLECCTSISEIQNEVESGINFATKTGNLYGLESFVSFRQIVKALEGKTVRYGSFNDEVFNEEEHLKNINHNGVALYYFYLYRALSAVIFCDYNHAYKLIKKAKKHLLHVSSFYVAALLRFLESLSICKVIGQEEVIKEKQIMEKTLEENQSWMYERAQDAPCNFQHLYDIVEAEIKMMEEKYDEGFKLYEKSMTEAENNNRTYHYALICEITGQRYLKMGLNRAAVTFIKDSYSRFSDWGAVAKTEWMKDEYKDILFSEIKSDNSLAKYNSLNCIDLKAIINVSQIISSEIERKKLLKKLMEIVMQNSGSTNGHILLMDEEKLVLLVSGGLNNKSKLGIDHKRIPFDSKDIKRILSSAIVNYVVRTKEVIIIDDVSISQFAYDNYFEENRIQSVVCLPILQQNSLKGIVYLENNILSGAFTENNIEVLKILSSQAAISIENAFLYSKLKNKVRERDKQISLSKEYDKVKMEFFSNISHELRTPINVIFSALQMYELNLKNCDKYNNIMKQNCYRLLRLVSNLIDITKIDTGYFDVSKININIISLVEDITMSVVAYIENKGLSLTFDTDVEEKIIGCDPEKIERIILNLLSNAIKFTPENGKIMVCIKDCNKNILISVKDNGRGIPKDKLNNIFERFVQVDKSFSRDHEGSGIGLSLVKALVELHGGTISVESSEGNGTEFIISLPCKLVDKTYDEVACCEDLNDHRIEKINIEFSDIYK